MVFCRKIRGKLQLGAIIAAVCVHASIASVWAGATATGTATVQVFETTSVVALQHLSVNHIVSGVGGGTLTIGADAKIHSSGSVSEIAGGRPAMFGSIGGYSRYQIKLPVQMVVLWSGNDSLTAENFSLSHGIIDSADFQYAIRIGATLNLGSGQPAGNYSGVLAVLIQYE